MKNGKKSYELIIGIVLPMLLICVFAFCSLGITLMGAQAYRKLQSNWVDEFGSSVAANYLRTKISQNNIEGSIYLKTEGDYNVLVIEDTQQEEPYETRIFVKDNDLKEIFVRKDTPFDENQGNTIAQVSLCEFSIDGGIFSAEIRSVEGGHTRVAVALAGGGAL